MINLYAGRFTTASTLALILASAGITLQAQDKPAIALHLSAPRDRVPLHAAPVANLIVENQGANAVRLDLGFDHIGAVILTISTPNGARRDEQKEPQTGMHEPGDVDIQPGASYDVRLILSEWQAFATEGSYSFSATIDSQYKDNLNNKLKVASNPITVTVTGPDPSALRAQCRDLLNTIASAGTYAEYSQAMRRLVTVDDSSAIPYLRDAAQYKPVFARMAVDAISSFKNQEAVDSLKVLAQVENPETRVFAIGGLQRMEHELPDGHLKDSIKEALEAIRGAEIKE